MGTPCGIERLRNSTFTTYGPGEGLPSGSGGPVHVDLEGRTWFAPSTGGLHWLKRGRVGSITTAALSEDVVYSIAGGKSGLWGGRKKGGLTHPSLQGQVATARRNRLAESAPDDSVHFPAHIR